MKRKKEFIEEWFIEPFMVGAILIAATAAVFFVARWMVSGWPAALAAVIVTGACWCLGALVIALHQDFTGGDDDDDD